MVLLGTRGDGHVNTCEGQPWTTSVHVPAFLSCILRIGQAPLAERPFLPSFQADAVA